ncbi:MAG: pyridoxal phosphate-dependent aminotransferase [Rickettsiales bacterium]|jgi:aspartate aminotransferase|nr:pyridoxal phosphate-dependent aminotransferase [Rickettsiales bacterium]
MYNLDEKQKIPLTINEKNLNKASSSNISYISQKSKELELEGRNIFKFGFANSPFTPPQNVLNALNAHRKADSYFNPQGLAELREKISDFHSTKLTTVTADNVFIAPGSKMMVFAILAIFKKASIYIAEPSVSFYDFQARILGHKVKKIPTDNLNCYLIDENILEKAFAKTPVNDNRQKILILNCPGHLNGSSYSKQQLVSITRICQRYNVLVISDELLSMLNYTDNHESIIDYYPEGTIVTTGISKSYAASNWRFSCCFYNREFGNNLKSSLLAICSSSYSYVSYPIQSAAMIAYDNLKKDHGYIIKQRRILQYLSEYSYNKFNNNNIITQKSSAGFCLLLDFSAYKEKFKKYNILDDSKLCFDILDSQNIVLLPASSFGMKNNDFLVRYAFVDFDGDAALENFTGSFTDAYCDKYFSRIFEGVNVIIDYVRNL